MVTFEFDIWQKRVPYRARDPVDAPDSLCNLVGLDKIRLSWISLGKSMLKFILKYHENPDTFSQVHKIFSILSQFDVNVIDKNKL